jgi:acetolactate decarboxylase
VTELEFLGALHVELLRHDQLVSGHADHELFQTSTVTALLDGAFEGDVTLRELLEHGDLGLGTLNGLDGELIVLDGEPWQAQVDATLSRPPLSARTPYAVVVPFSPGSAMPLTGPLPAAELESRLRHRAAAARRPTAIRIDGFFHTVTVRSVPRQAPPYPTLAQAIAQEQVTELSDVRGTLAGFRFPDALDGIEMVGAHLHFATDDRARGGHVLGYTLMEGVAHLDDPTELHVELPGAVDAPGQGTTIDQAALQRLESSR